MQRDYLESVYKFSFSVMPDLIRHPEGLERTGFRLEFTPLQNGAGMTLLFENDIYGQTLLKENGHGKLNEIDNNIHEIIYQSTQNPILHEILENIQCRCERL